MAKKTRIPLTEEGGFTLGDLLRAKGIDLPDAPEGSVSPDTSQPPTHDETPVTQGKVVLRKERKGHGGKTVTRVEGMEGDLRVLAKTLRKALGCGVRVEGDCLLIQGDQRERARDWLEGQGIRQIVVS